MRNKQVNTDKTSLTINTYDNIVEEYNKYFNNTVQFQKEIDYIVNQLKEGSTILDAGCATGIYSKYLTEVVDKSFKVIGIDASKNMIDFAKQHALLSRFQIMDIRKLQFQKNSFDAIICFATLIHLTDEDCLKVLNSFDEIIKENGLIAINVMEYENGEKQTLEVEPFNPKYKTYFNRYTKDFFINYFIKNNYQVLKTFDNPVFNKDKMKGTFNKTNQFSIIVKKMT